MNKQFIYLASILVLAMAATFAVTAQETNANATLNSTSLNNTTANRIAQNLSTVNGQPIVVANISDMAGVAPLVTAGASSAQVAGKSSGSFKIGTGVGGIDPFNPQHVEIETLKLGIPIKAMRDTGKMFFVCDLV